MCTHQITMVCVSRAQHWLGDRLVSQPAGLATRLDLCLVERPAQKETHGATMGYIWLIYIYILWL